MRNKWRLTLKNLFSGLNRTTCCLLGKNCKILKQEKYCFICDYDLFCFVWNKSGIKFAANAEKTEFEQIIAKKSVESCADSCVHDAVRERKPSSGTNRN